MLELVQTLSPANLANLPTTLLWLAAGGVTLLLLGVIFFVKPEDEALEPVTEEPEIRSRVARKKRKRG